MSRNEIIIYNNYQLFLVLDEISNEINFKFKHLNKDNFHFKDEENFEYNLIIYAYYIIFIHDPSWCDTIIKLLLMCY